MSTNLCLIGAGRIGRIHAGNIVTHPDAVLRYVIDVDRDAASELARQTAATATDLDTALADAAVDGVVIASSTDTHLPFIEASAQAGKAVFCEKPLDLDVARAGQCIAAAAQAGTALYIGFNRRYDPSFLRLHTDIGDDRIGTVECISITSRDPSPPPLDYVRRSGGLFRDMTIHDFDMARWLLGSEPVSVYATGACLVEPGIGDAGDIDSAAVVLRTASGSLCQITNSRRCSYGYDQRIEVFGSDGMLAAGNESATRVSIATADGFLSEPALPFFLERYRVAYAGEIDDFVHAIAGRPHRLASGEDGLNALLLADAAERSQTLGQAVDMVG